MTFTDISLIIKTNTPGFNF